MQEGEEYYYYHLESTAKTDDGGKHFFKHEGKNWRLRYMDYVVCAGTLAVQMLLFWRCL